MKKSFILLIICLTSCTTTKELFSTLENSADDTYGYSVNNPILIGVHSNWQRNAELSLIYLSKLTYNDRPLQCILHATVEKPANQPRKRKSIPLIYGVPTSLGGMFLDKYLVVPRGTKDTIALYFDEEIKGTLKVPKGFGFNIDQLNNVYR